jgi:carbonic anhydrase
MMKYTNSAFMAALFAAQTFAASGVFDYKQNGADWGNNNPLCKFGVEQSPIDLTQSGAETAEDMQLNGYGYKDYPTQTVFRTDHTIVANVGEGEFQLDFHDGSKSLFTPLQFHFHAPSEHSVNGKLYDLEMHIVHYYKDTNVSLGGVIGIFFDREAGGNFNNPFLDSLKFGETVKGDEGIQVQNLNLASLLGSIDFRKYWNYRGSLTTPPCSEGIKWTVIEQV